MNLLLRCVLLYYALPSLVFFYGWYEPWVSIPCIALVLWGVLRAEAEVPAPVVLKGRSLWLFVIGALLICSQQWMVGYTGHFPQHTDFEARNAVFGSLCRESWPMASKEGYPFVYYAAAWLPSAALKKCIPVLNADWLFMIQNSIALVAAFWLLCCRMRRVSLWILAGAFCLGAFPRSFRTAYDVFFGTDWVGHFYGASIFPRWNDLMLQTSAAVNHGPYLILATCLVLLPLRRPVTYILIGALLLPISPLGAIGLFPFLIWRLFRGGVRIKPILCSFEAWSGLLILLACALYYAQSAVQGSTTAFIWQLPIFGDVYRRIFLLIVVNVGLFGLIFIPFCYKRVEFWIAYGLFAVLPFIYYGYNYNELIFKASCVCFTVFAALLPGLFAEKGHRLSKALVILMLTNYVIVSVHTLCRDLPYFGDREHNVAHIYKGDYYGEEAIASRKLEVGFRPFPTSDVPPRILIPHILKTPPTR